MKFVALASIESAPSPPAIPPLGSFSFVSSAGMRRGGITTSLTIVLALPRLSFSAARTRWKEQLSSPLI